MKLHMVPLIATLAIAGASCTAQADDQVANTTVVHAKKGDNCRWFLVPGANSKTGAGYYAVGDVDDWTAILLATANGSLVEFKFDPTITVSCGLGHGLVSGPIVNIPLAHGVYF